MLPQQDYLYLVQLYKFREIRLQSIYKPYSGFCASEKAGLAKLQNYIDNDFMQMLKELGIDHLICQTQPHKATKAYLDWMMSHSDIASFYELNLIQAPCSYVSTREILLLLGRNQADES